MGYQYCDYLLTLLGSVMESPVGVAEGGGACGSVLHELSTSPGSALGCCCCSSGIGLLSSSILLLWSDGVDGLEDDTVGGSVTDKSSENIDMSCSSSKRSKPLFPCMTTAVLEFRHSSMNGASRKAMESLIDRRWDPRRADEKSRNSSTQEGCCCCCCCCCCCWCWCWCWVLLLVLWFVEMKFAIIGIRWWGDECQFWVMLGILGGNCAIWHTKIESEKCVLYVQERETNLTNQNKNKNRCVLTSNIH